MIFDHDLIDIVVSKKTQGIYFSKDIPTEETYSVQEGFTTISV